MTSKCKKSQIWPFRPWKMTFRAIQPNLSFDMRFMSPKRSFMPKKKKSYWSVSEIDPSPPQSWRTDRRTDRRTDGRTDRRTTDKSVLEKLRCLSAGGAKKPIPIFWYFISQLLVEISIWNSYRTLIGSLSIHWKKMTLIGQMSRSQGRYIVFWRYSHITKTEPYTI